MHQLVRPGHAHYRTQAQITDPMCDHIPPPCPPGLARAADKPGHEVASVISLKHVYEIARVKQRDMPNVPLQSICSAILRSCRSMGVRVVARPEDA